MPRALSDIFKDNPQVEVIEIEGCRDDGPFGIYCDGRKIKIYDINFARDLVGLPGSNTDTGHITKEGYYIHAAYNIYKDCYKASVYRLPPEKRMVK